jgi:hypothetical protein
MQSVSRRSIGAGAHLRELEDLLERRVRHRCRQEGLAGVALADRGSQGFGHLVLRGPFFTSELPGVRGRQLETRRDVLRARLNKCNPCMANRELTADTLGLNPVGGVLDLLSSGRFRSRLKGMCVEQSLVQPLVR